MSKLPKRISAEAVGKAILRNIRAATYDVWQAHQKEWPPLKPKWVAYKRRKGGFTEIWAFTGRTLRSIASGTGATTWKIFGRGSKSEIRLVTTHRGIEAAFARRPWPEVFEDPRYIAAVQAGFYEALVDAGFPEKAAKGVLTGARGGAAGAIRKGGVSGIKQWRKSGGSFGKAKAFVERSKKVEHLRKPAHTKKNTVKRPISLSSSRYMEQFKKKQKNLRGK